MSLNYAELEKLMRKNGDMNYGGCVSIPIGTQVPADTFRDHFVAASFDMWSIDPNISINNDYWQLNADKSAFVKTYEVGNPEPHDHRWTVFPDTDNTKLSIAYKGDPVTSLETKLLGIDGSSTVAAQRAVLKLLSKTDGVQSFLDIVDDSTRHSLVSKYPELGK